MAERTRWRLIAAAVALAGLGLAVRRESAAPRVLWYQGVAVRWAGDTGVALGPDGLLLRFHPGRRAAWLPVEADGRTLLEAAAGADGAVWLVDGSGAIVRRRDDGTLEDVGRTPFDVPSLASGPSGMWAARSAVQFTYRPEDTSAPLAVRLTGGLQVSAEAGGAIIPDNPFLTQLANAGRVLPLPDGGVVVAPFVRDLVIRYDADGVERWRTRRGLGHETPNPSMRVEDEDGQPRLIADYAPVNLGLAQGPDGTIYVLSTVAARTDSSRLDALDAASGTVRRTWWFGTGVPTLVLEPGGSIAESDPARLLPAVPADAREALTPFALETPAGDTLRLESLRGRVVVLNFWASWCGPCRDEFPALDSLAARFDTAVVRFVGLSDDVSRSAADRFLAAHPAPHMTIAYGDGDLRSRYHYVGLPFTMLLDAEGRILRRWIGYMGADQLAEIAVLAGREGGQAVAPGIPAAHSH